MNYDSIIIIALLAYTIITHNCNGACRDLNITSAVLRLECSIDCISGSVGHQHNIFRSFSHSAFLLKKKKIQNNVITKI